MLNGNRLLLFRRFSNVTCNRFFLAHNKRKSIQLKQGTNYIHLYSGLLQWKPGRGFVPFVLKKLPACKFLALSVKQNETNQFSSLSENKYVRKHLVKALFGKLQLF
jgi:hypothetical protein